MKTVTAIGDGFPNLNSLINTIGNKVQMYPHNQTLENNEYLSWGRVSYFFYPLAFSLYVIKNPPIFLHFSQSGNQKAILSGTPSGGFTLPDGSKEIAVALSLLINS